MTVKCCGSCRHITGFTKYSGILWCILCDEPVRYEEKCGSWSEGIR